MSRFRRVVQSTLSGYTALAATALYALFSVPLALHYLSAEKFALWALMSSIGGYLNLIDLGMSGSLARLLIDHKDDKLSGTYGSLVQTGWLVLVVQGTLLLSIGYGLAPVLAHLLGIEPALQGEFIALLRWQSAALALSFSARISSHLLSAHQRLDIVYYLNIASLSSNLLLQWLFFHLGAGVFSLTWGCLSGAALGAAVSQLVCWRLGFFPPAGTWGRVSWARFREMFSYGSDLFLVAVGYQLISASQTLIVTRVLGLQAAAAWSVGTRAFTYLSQLVWRIWDVSGPAMAEMLVRNERVLLRQRYQTLLSVTASLGCYAAVGHALCNSLFVSVWTHGRISWTPFNDILLGLWMVVLAVLHCHSCFVLLTKRIGFMRYIYFFEGLVFVGTAFVAARYFGTPGMILASVVCSTLFSGAYCVWRASRYFGLSLYEVGFAWVAPMWNVLIFFGPAAVGCWWLTFRLGQPVSKLSINVLLAGTLGLYIFARLGVQSGLKKELLQRAPRPLKPALARLFCQP